MLYTIVEAFAPSDGEKWSKYKAWRGRHFERFDSIDGMLRPSLFQPTTERDWDNVVTESFMTHLITNREYALARRREIGDGVVLEIRTDSHACATPEFLGFEIIDGHWSVSLLTNWGTEYSFIDDCLGPNGLIPEIGAAQRVHERLLSDYSDDSHAGACILISLYRT